MINVAAAGIKTMTDTVCKSITESGVVVEKEGERQEIPADTVVLAVGSRPNDSSGLADYCEKQQIPYRIIGDAAENRRAAVPPVIVEKRVIRRISVFLFSDTSFLQQRFPASAEPVCKPRTLPSCLLSALRFFVRTPRTGSRRN